MAYCGGATQANANYLASKTGLNPSVALAWLKNECQSTPNPTNPLNIRYYGTNGQTGKIGGFGTYASTTAGLDAAARLVNGGAYYSGIRAAIKSGNPAAQAHAIELSPWAAGHYGGSSTHYGNITKALTGILKGTIVPSLPGKVPSPGGTTPNAILTGAVAAPPWINDPTHVLTPADLQTLKAWVLGNSSVSNKTALSTYLDGWLLHVGPFIGNGQVWAGKTLGELQTANPQLFKPVTDTQTGLGTDPITLLGNAIGAVGNALGKAMGFGAGLVFIILGVFIYSKSVRSKVEAV